MYSVLLQAAGPNAGIMQMVLLGGMIIVFYFFMIRPQSQKAKQAKEFQEKMQKGDKIVTIGGIHGKIADVQETTFLIEVEGGHKLKLEKSAVSMDSSTMIGADQK